MAASYSAQALGEGVHADLVPGAYKSIFIVVTGDTSYPTGGYTLSVANLNTVVPALEINQVKVANDWLDATDSLSFRAVWNNATGKVLAFGSNATPGPAVADPQVTAATDVHLYKCTLEVSFR